MLRLSAANARMYGGYRARHKLWRNGGRVAQNGRASLDWSPQTRLRGAPVDEATQSGPSEALMMPARGYLLCCIPRTGGSLLGQALGGTGVAGRPLEYFNPAAQQKPWMRAILGESDLVEGLPKILSAGTTPNGWFGAKLHGSHFRHLGIRINTGKWQDSPPGPLLELLQSRLPELLPQEAAYELLRSRFSDRSHATAYAFLRSALPDMRFIWLKRQNRVARAISEYRARKTGLWYLPASQSDAVAKEHLHDFDLAQIHNLLCLGGFHEELLERLFRQQGISPYCLSYEDLAADYESTVRRVLKFLDLDAEQALIPPPRIRKQSDALSQEWEERYRKLSVEAGI